MSAVFDWSSFIEVPGFHTRWAACGCDDADLRQLQLDLLEDPTGWPVVPTSGGWRKARFAPPSWGQGRSGGLRVYYAELPTFGRIYLATAFTKSETVDIPAADKRRMGRVLAAIRRQLEEQH